MRGFLLLLAACTGPVKAPDSGEAGADSAPPRSPDGEVHDGPGTPIGDGTGGGDDGAGDSSDWVSVPAELTLIADDDPASSTHSGNRQIDGTGEISTDGETLTATIDYWWERDGDIRCDAQIGLTGTLVSGACEQCDFAFKVDAEVLEDNGDYTCDMINGWTSLSDGYFVNQHLGFGESYDLYTGGMWRSYDDVLLTGYGINHDYFGEAGGYQPGPYWSPLIWTGEDSTQGWAALDDGTLTWGFEQSGDYNQLNHYLSCDQARRSDTTEGWLEGTMVTGQVDCSPTLMDGWSVVLPAGSLLHVTVDAPEEDSYFTPYIWVNGPDGCAVADASTNFICTGMERFSSAELCASLAIPVHTAGVYEIWIVSLGTNCRPSTTVDYSLYVDLREPSTNTQ